MRPMFQEGFEVSKKGVFLRDHKLIMLGVLLLAFVVACSIVIPMRAQNNYSYFRYWLRYYPMEDRENPKYAYPEIINVVLGPKYAPTTTIRYIGEPSLKSYHNFLLAYLNITYNMKYDHPPQDIVIEASLNLTNISGAIIVKIIMVRPDGLEILGFKDKFVGPDTTPAIVHIFGSNFIDDLKKELLKHGYSSVALNISDVNAVRYLFMDPSSMKTLSGKYTISMSILFLGSVEGNVSNVVENYYVRILGKAHGLMGTDNLRRDVLVATSTALKGTLLTSVIVAVLSTTLGLFIGMYSAFSNSIGSKVMRALIDSFNTLPYVPLIAILLWATATGRMSTNLSYPAWMMGVIISLFMWSRPAKGISGFSRKLLGEPFIEATRCLGAGRAHIMVRHLLPNLLEYYISQIVLSLPRSVIVVVLIGALGISIGPNLGTYIAQVAGPEMFTVSAWWVMVPSIFYLGTLGVGIALISYDIERGFRRTL